MNALVRKEIRLLLPMWVATLLLALLPNLLNVVLGAGARESDVSDQIAPMVLIFVTGISGLLLGLTSFGREISTHTFSLLLAQPRRRTDLWRTKIKVLLGAVGLLYLFLALVNQNFMPANDRGTAVLLGLAFVGATVSGGLWTTLLLRQVIAAFWISLLIPYVIQVTVFILILNEQMIQPAQQVALLLAVLLLVYSVAGYWFARWQFIHAQDTAWTGGNLALPQMTRRRSENRAAVAVPSARPLRALLGKELRFQQINFLLAGGLLVMQLIFGLMKPLMHIAESSMLNAVISLFWMVWIIMPALVGGSAIAEERRFGMLEAQLCLPVSRHWQFALKALVILGCGVLLGAAVPVALALMHPGSNFSIPAWIIGCAIVALMAFYASSLTQQLLQALCVAIGILVVGFGLSMWLARSSSPGNWFALFGCELWCGPVVLIVGAGVMLLAAVALSWRRWRWACLLMLGVSGLFFLNFPTTYALSSDTLDLFDVLLLSFVFCLAFLVLALALRNFNHLRPTVSLWRRNAFIWLGCLLATGILTPPVYHRVWELFMRVEPPAHAARLSGDTRPAIISLYYGRPLLVLLPDGRLSCIREFERWIVPAMRDDSNCKSCTETIWRALERPGADFIGGSNWVQVASTLSEVVGIKADGTLWSAPWYELVDATGKIRPSKAGVEAQKGERWREVELRFEQVGEENDWKAISASGGYCIALKQNGTIWGWGDNRCGQLGDGPKVLTNGPVRIGAQADWVAVCAGPFVSIAINQAGEVWRWGQTTFSYPGSGPGRLNFKVSEVRTIGWNGFDVILGTDGFLWGLGFVPPPWVGGDARELENVTTPLRLLGKNWSAFSMGWDLAAIKHDGSLWRFPISRDDRSIASRPIRLGRRKDWIAVHQEQSSILALARDGTLCRFGDPGSDWRRELLAPTRRVTWSANVLGEQE